MDYREYPPSAILAPFVERFWTLTGHAEELEGGAQPVMPDGRPEIVLHFGDPFERVGIGGAASRQARRLFAGQLTDQLTLRPTGRVAVLGVRFHSFGAAAFIPAPQHELAGLTIGVDLISRPLARALELVEEHTGDVHCAVPFVQNALERSVRDELPMDRRLRFAANTIQNTGGLVSIDRLAERVSMSRRQLERDFLKNVGISPKRLARITRFQRALRVLEGSDPRRRGTVTAVTCGYADQSHFIREFRQLAGCSPAEHMLRQGELTGFFVARSQEDRRPETRQRQELERKRLEGGAGSRQPKS